MKKKEKLLLNLGKELMSSWFKIFEKYEKLGLTREEIEVYLKMLDGTIKKAD